MARARRCIRSPDDVTSVVGRLTLRSLSGVLICALSFAVTSGRAQAVDSLARPADRAAEIGGTVTGKGGRPVNAAEVRIDALQAAVRSDSSGSFALRGLPAGTHVIVVRAVGYELVARTVILAATTRATVSVQLAETTPILDTVRTTAKSDPYRTGFTRRMARHAGGHFLTREQIRASGLTRVTDLLRRVPGLRMRTLAEGTILEFGGRGTRTFSPEGCPIAITIDGAPYDLAFYGIDGEVRVENVEAIEVYDAATAPAEFARRGAGCGLILIWTRERAVEDPSPDANRPR